MWQKVIIVWEVVKGFTSLYKSAKKMYADYKRNKLRKKIEMRKAILLEIGKVAKMDPTEETDEKLVELYNKLYALDTSN